VILASVYYPFVALVLTLDVIFPCTIATLDSPEGAAYSFVPVDQLTPQGGGVDMPLIALVLLAKIIAAMGILIAP